MILRRTTVLALLIPSLATAQVPTEKVLERYRQMLAANPSEGTALDRLWQAYADQGRTGELLAEYEKAQDFPGRMTLGFLRKKAGLSPGAIEAFKDALILEPKNPAPLLALGRLETADGHGAQGAIWLAKAVELLPDEDPRKGAALIELGTAHLDAGDVALAAEAWEKTVALSPLDLALRRQLADIYVQNRLGSRALPHLEFLNKHGQPPERAQALQQTAAIYQTLGEQDNAIAALERALALTGPGNWLRGELQNQLIRLYQRYHRTAELEAKWKTLAEENPRDLGACLQLIDLYDRLGDQAQQLAWIERLITLAPKQAEYRLRLARLLAQMDQLQRAAQAYDDLLGSQPRNIELVFERARIDVQRDDEKAATARIEALLDRANEDEGIRGKALEFYLTHRLLDAAEEHLREDARNNDEAALLSLAQFLFRRNRDADAMEILGRLLRPGDAPDRQAAAHFRIAEQLKTQNDVPRAIARLREAISLAEGVREYHFMLGELEAARGHYIAAETAFERAFALSTTPADQIEADQRLYDSLRQQKEPSEEPSRTGLPRPDSAAAATSTAAQAFLLRLLREAVDQPTPGRWLRVARWQQWSRNFRASVDAAQKALAIAPDSVEAHDFLARLHASDPSGSQAAQHLRELAKIDPANRVAYLRRLGHVLTQSGQTEEALRNFRELIEENPGDVEMLHDLALAQQRADQWKESLGTLRQIYQLSPAPRKREAVTALLRVFDRMQLRQEAADLLLEQIDREADDRGRFALFQDLLNHCTRHGLLDWLREAIERRGEQRVDDYFAEVALGRVLKAQGNKAAAFEVLADAAVSAPNPAEALPELVREAEELRRLDSAIQLQSRLVRVVPQTTPEGLERLAQLQEKALQSDEAARTWSRLLARFPRDVQVLEKAAEFERVWGAPERSAGVLRRLLQIEPENIRALSQLSEMCLAEGHTEEAAACLEKVLAQTPPEKPGEPVVFPAVRTDDPSRLEIAYRATVTRRQGRTGPDGMRALRTFWFEKPGDPRIAADRRQRLQTIRDLARITAARNDPAQTAAWAARWQAPGISNTEKLWALYFSGASGPLLDEVEKLMAERSDDGSAVTAFIWLALQTGEFDRLARWTHAPGRTPPERDFLMVALEQYLDDHHGRVPAALIRDLLPEGHRVRLWQMASMLSQRGFFREAIELGNKVFESISTQKALCGVELAQWHIALGEVELARNVLRQSISLGGEHLGNPHFAALRALHQLLPEAERAPFVQEQLNALDDQKRPVQAVMTRLLFAALDGNHSMAVEQLSALHSMRPISNASNAEENATAATRYWDFVLLTGSQLMAWNFDRLAVEWWTQALKDDAAIRLQRELSPGHTDSVQDRVSQARIRLAAARLLRADAFEFDAVLHTFQPTAPPEGLLPLAETLESLGAYPAAVTIYRRLWAMETSNPHALRNALSACRTAQDWNTLEEILQRVVTEGYFLQNDAAHRDLVLQWVDVLARRGELTGARALLMRLLDGNRNDTRAMLKLGELHQRAGDSVAAEATFNGLLAIEPSNIPARLALAGLFDESGRPAAAMDVLERAGGVEIDSRLAILSLKLDRLDDALATLDRLPETDRPRVSLEMANTLAERGDEARALRLLRAALGRTIDPSMGIALQKRLIELLPVHTEPAAARREFRRLQQFLDGSVSESAEFFAVAQAQASRFGVGEEYREELLRLWASGKGDPSAGAVLLAWQLAGDGDGDWRATWMQLRAHPGMNAASADRALRAFESAGELDAATEAHGLVARLNPSEPQRLLDWARAAVRAGRTPDALRIAAELRRRAVFSPDLLPSAATLLAELGERKKALEVYSQVLEADPTAHRYERYIEAADLLLAENRHATARRVLLAARRNPATPMAPALARYLEATDRTEPIEESVAAFDLAGHALVELRREVFRRMLETGRLEGALALANAHRDLLDGDAFVNLREAARTQRVFEPVAALLDQEVRQNSKAPTAVFAALLADWADADLESLQIEAALTHLAQAHQLDPSSWRIADQLSSLHLERGENQQAAEILRNFLSASPEAPERDRAMQRLDRIPSA